MQTQEHFSTAVSESKQRHTRRERERQRETETKRNQKLYFTRIVERDR